MTLRPPKAIFAAVRSGNPLAALETEILEESASSLGYYGKKAEAALARLKTVSETGRQQATDDAAEAVWNYFIQREMCGMGDQSYLIREMGVPRAVLNRMGMRRAHKAEKGGRR